MLSPFRGPNHQDSVLLQQGKPSFQWGLYK